MNRRRFLTLGLATASAAAGAGATVAAGEYQLHENIAPSGHAVGRHRPHGIHSTTITWRASVDTKVLALTFDDGPSSDRTPAVLDILDRADVPATFFCLGKHVARRADLVKHAAERHEIGNHGWDHRDLSLATATQAREQLERCHDEITHATGVSPTVFRPPYGRFSGATTMVAAGMGYSMVLWDNRFDTTKSGASNVDALAASTVAGTILLAHDGGPLDAGPVLTALPDLIDRLRDQDFRFVTISELLALQAAAWDTDKPDDDGQIQRISTTISR